jgi:hypothetical protein
VYVSCYGTAKQNKTSSMKKKTFLVLGLLLVIGTLFGGNLEYLSDWSTSELVGYNSWTIVALLGGVYLIYKGFKK